MYAGLVTDPTVARYFAEEEGWYDRPQSVVLSRPAVDANLGRGGEPKAAERAVYVLDEEDESLERWVSLNSLPLVTFLTTRTFALLAGTGKPMAILFLDWKAAGTGGLDNTALMSELRGVARGFGSDVSVVVADGSDHLDRMAVVGVQGGVSALPAFVMNGADGRSAVMGSEVPLNEDTMGAFVAGFLKGGEGGGSSMALKAAKRNTRNRAVRSEPEKDKGEVRVCVMRGAKRVAKEGSFCDLETTPAEFAAAMLRMRSLSSPPFPLPTLTHLLSLSGPWSPRVNDLIQRRRIPRPSPHPLQLSLRHLLTRPLLAGYALQADGLREVQVVSRVL